MSSRRRARRVQVSVNISIPSLDERVWRTTEPGTAPPRQRLRALRILRDGGIRVGVALAPILPGISDSPDSMAAVVRAAREAGASFLWSELLHLRPGTREHFLSRLAEDWPQELTRYQRLYAGRAYLGRPELDAVKHQLAAIKQSIPTRMNPVPLIEAPPPPEQLDLAV
jgi:DNA repair photolyase